MEGLDFLKMPAAIAALSIPSAIAMSKANEQHRQDRVRMEEEQKEAFSKGMEAIAKEISAW